MNRKLDWEAYEIGSGELLRDVWTERERERSENGADVCVYTRGKREREREREKKKVIIMAPGGS